MNTIATALVVILIASFVIAADVNMPSEPEIKNMWVKFAHKYERHLLGTFDMKMRYDIFKNNVQRIYALNAMYNTNTFGITRFTDMTQDEFRNNYLMRPKTPEQMRKTMKGATETTPISTNDIPTEIDWRKLGAVTEVKNQGSCGSCWAFSATGNIEGQHFLKTKQLVSLSEQNLVDCDHTCVEYEHEKSCDQGCDGGLMWSAFQYVVKNGGIDTEKSYKYEGYDDKCRYKNSTSGATIDGWKMMPTDETQLAAVLATNGPISIAINADPLQFYESGILSAKDCDPTSLDHGVLLIGYGVEKNIPYWIVKNSWGSGWGESGTFRIVRGKNACGLASVPCSAIIN